MAKREAKYIFFDVQSLEADGQNLRVRIVPAGAIERTSTGLTVRTGGITNAMLDGQIAFEKLADYVNIARLDQNEIIVGQWNFPDGANQPTINGKVIASEEYVDVKVQGLTGKGSVKVLSDTNIAISGIPTNIDGVTDLADGDKVLLTNQTTGSENGIWIVRSGAWDRPDNYAAGSHASSAFVFVEEGTQYHDQGWSCITDEPNDVVNTDATTWNQFSGAGQITAGPGLLKTGNQLEVLPLQFLKGGDVELDGDKICITYTPVNYTRNTNGALVDDPEHLTAHLQGIDARLGAMPGPRNFPFTLSATDVTNKYITLPAQPYQPGSVKLVMHGGGSMVYGEDFQMDGTTPERLTWAGLDLDGIVSTGDKGIVHFDV